MSDQYPGQQPPQGPYNPQGQYQPYNNQGYTPMHPNFQPPMQQPAKKSRKGLWIALAVIAIVALGLCGIISVATSSASHGVTASTTSDTTSSTSTGKWTTTHTFTGNGAKKTATFSVGDDWKIVYSCSGMDIGGTTADANLIVSVNNSDSTPVDPAAINTICKAGKTSSDNTEEHTSGNVYLDVNADAQWTIQIQELK